MHTTPYLLLLVMMGLMTNAIAQTSSEQQLESALVELGSTMQQDIENYIKLDHGYHGNDYTPPPQVSNEVYWALANFYDRLITMRHSGFTGQNLTSFIKKHLFAGWTPEEIQQDQYINLVITEEIPTEWSHSLSEELKEVVLRQIVTDYWATVIAMAVVAEKKMPSSIDTYDDGADYEVAKEALTLELSPARLASAALVGLIVIESSEGFNSSVKVAILETEKEIEELLDITIGGWHLNDSDYLDALERFIRAVRKVDLSKTPILKRVGLISLRDDITRINVRELGWGDKDISIQIPPSLLLEEDFIPKLALTIGQQIDMYEEIRREVAVKLSAHGVSDISFSSFRGEIGYLDLTDLLSRFSRKIDEFPGHLDLHNIKEIIIERSYTPHTKGDINHYYNNGHIIYIDSDLPVERWLPSIMALLEDLEK